MKNSKRVLIMAIAALMLVFVPAEAKASVTTEEPIAVKKDVQIKEGEQLISQKTYEDEDGNEVTEKVYVTFDKQAVKSAMSRSGIKGNAEYTKEQVYSIPIGKTQKGKLRCYANGTFRFENGRVYVTKHSGRYTRSSTKIITSGAKAMKGSNYVRFRVYAKSDYSKKKEYAVKLTALGDGRVY
ncbi:MAG: hypothetical protein HFJ04_08290 [Lachnospiraceae bacterium]|nr:hypothetical protein [Lachnospiraceae bacterium]